MDDIQNIIKNKEIQDIKIDYHKIDYVSLNSEKYFCIDCKKSISELCIEYKHVILDKSEYNKPTTDIIETILEKVEAQLKLIDIDFGTFSLDLLSNTNNINEEIEVKLLSKENSKLIDLYNLERRFNNFFKNESKLNMTKLNSFKENLTKFRETCLDLLSDHLKSNSKIYSGNILDVVNINDEDFYDIHLIVDRLNKGKVALLDYLKVLSNDFEKLKKGYETFYNFMNEEIERIIKFLKNHDLYIKMSNFEESILKTKINQQFVNNNISNLNINTIDKEIKDIKYYNYPLQNIINNGNKISSSSLKNSNIVVNQRFTNVNSIIKELVEEDNELTNVIYPKEKITRKNEKGNINNELRKKNLKTIDSEKSNKKRNRIFKSINNYKNTRNSFSNSSITLESGTITKKNIEDNISIKSKKIVSNSINPILSNRQLVIFFTRKELKENRKELSYNKSLNSFKSFATVETKIENNDKENFKRLINFNNDKMEIKNKNTGNKNCIDSYFSENDNGNKLKNKFFSPANCKNRVILPICSDKKSHNSNKNLIPNDFLLKDSANEFTSGDYQKRKKKKKKIVESINKIDKFSNKLNKNLNDKNSVIRKGHSVSIEFNCDKSHCNSNYRKFINKSIDIFPTNLNSNSNTKDHYYILDKNSNKKIRNKDYSTVRNSMRSSFVSDINSKNVYFSNIKNYKEKIKEIVINDEKQNKGKFEKNIIMKRKLENVISIIVFEISSFKFELVEPCLKIDSTIKKFYEFSIFLNVNNVLYISGGKRKNKSASRTFIKFDYHANKLVQLTDMNYKRYSHSMIYYSDNNCEYIICVGGYNNKTCERYSIKENIWENLPQLNNERQVSSLLIINKIYLISLFGFIPDSYVKITNHEEIEMLNLRDLSLWKVLSIKLDKMIGFNFKLFNVGIINSKDKILIIGGETYLNKETNNIYSFNCDDNYNFSFSNYEINKEIKVHNFSFIDKSFLPNEEKTKYFAFEMKKSNIICVDIVDNCINIIKINC